jgi:hypothetical protein
MKFVKPTNSGILITLCLFGAMIVPKARADGWDKKTTLSFNEPVLRLLLGN